MDNIRVERDGENDLSKYSPEQLKIIIEGQAEDAKRKLGGRVVLSLGGIVLAGVLLIPVIARLYQWGFGG